MKKTPEGAIKKSYLVTRLSTQHKLLCGLSMLAHVAGRARYGDIVPVVRTAPAYRQHMVEVVITE